MTRRWSLQFGLLVGICFCATTALASGFFGGGGGGTGDVTTVGDCTTADCFEADNTGTENSIYFEGTTDNAAEIRVTGADPSSDVTITIPAVTGTLISTGDTGTVTGTMILNDTVALTTDTSGNYVTSVTTSVLTGLTGGNTAAEGTNSALAFDYTTTLSGDVGMAANAGIFGASGLAFEGSSADTAETYVTLVNPTADRDITLPDRSGTVMLSGDTLTGDVASTFSSSGSMTATVQANSVALTTDTTGNYAAGDAEAGAALTGDTATAFFTLGELEVSRGGTGAAPGADDQVLVSDSTSAGTWRTLPSCSGATTDKLLYTTASNSFSCGSDQGGATAWDAIANPAGAGAIAMAETVQTLDWDSAATAAAYDALSFTVAHDSTSDSATQRLVVVERDATAGTATFETLLEINNNDTDGLVSTALAITSAPGNITTAIDVSDAEIGTAIALGSNDITTTGPTTISEAEIDRLDGLAGTIVTDTTAVTNVDGDGMTITSGNLNVVAGTAITVAADSVGITPDGVDGASLTDAITLDAATSLGDGGVTNYTTFSTAGVITYTGTARPRRTIVLTAGGSEASTAAAASAVIDGTNVDRRVLDYDAATDEQRFWTLVIPDSFTALNDAQFNWQAAATSGDVIWTIQGACVTDAEAADATLSTAQTVTDTALGTANQKNEAAVTSLSFAGSCAAGELMYVRVTRDADAGGDTMAGDARLISVELEYTAGAESD